MGLVVRWLSIGFDVGNAASLPLVFRGFVSTTTGTPRRPRGSGAGLPLGEVARRPGHSVETFVSVYTGALDGDEEIGNRRIQAVLAESSVV
jgi:hypothetical protein